MDRKRVTEGAPPNDTRARRAGRLGTTALTAILLAEGYGSLSVEILALRRMVPWAGSTIMVTAVLLTVYLAGLAAGYATGGRRARRGGALEKALARRLAAAAVLAGIWLGEAGPTVVFLLPGPTLFHVWVYAVAGIGPIAWLLAESVLLAHGCAREREPSERAGGVFAVSTAGNVAGALTTTFVLMATLGTASAVLAVCGSLLAAALTASRREVGVGAAAAAFLLPGHSLWIEATVYTRRNAYADYRIETVDNARILHINRQAASRDDTAGTGWPYLELIEDALCERQETQVLVLGAAGRTLGRGRDCGLQPVFVDIDREQEEISEGLLAGPAPGPLQTSDARTYLRTNTRPWDAIVADAYTHANSVPSHLVTREFFQAARGALRPGGTLYVNQITYPGNEIYQARFDRTLRAVFAGCRSRSIVTRGPDPDWHAVDTTPMNRVYRCPRRSDDGDTTIYTDARPRADLDRAVR